MLPPHMSWTASLASFLAAWAARLPSPPPSAKSPAFQPHTRERAMRETLELKVEPRSKLGKGASYQTRKSGLIPGIIYGGGGGPASAQARERTFGRVRSTGAPMQTLLMLGFSGTET